jgi:hypothetical protein
VTVPERLRVELETWRGEEIPFGEIWALALDEALGVAENSVERWRWKAALEATRLEWSRAYHRLPSHCPGLVGALVELSKPA